MSMYTKNCTLIVSINYTEMARHYLGIVETDKDDVTSKVAQMEEHPSHLKGL